MRAARIVPRILDESSVERRPSATSRRRIWVLLLRILVVCGLALAAVWGAFAVLSSSSSSEPSIVGRPRNNNGASSALTAAKDPLAFLLGFVPSRPSDERSLRSPLLLCAGDAAEAGKLGRFAPQFTVSARKRNCDVYVVRDEEDLRVRGLPRLVPGGHVVWSWAHADWIRKGPKIFGDRVHPLQSYLDRHLLRTVFRFEQDGRTWALLRKPERPFVNPSLEAFLRDRANPEYSAGPPRSREAYCFIITIPYNFDRDMLEEHTTAVHQLRKKDGTRDVNVFLVLNTPPGAVDGRGWGKTTEVEWNRTYLPQIESVRRRFERLGARVFVRPRIPQKPSDDAMYYQFDYQKIYAWNLRYEQIAYLDADMMIGDDPGSVFALCGQHFFCAVQDPGAYGGYVNNGFFVVNGKLEFAEELLHSWWKDNPPWRQICLQDIMNEVFAERWKPLPENFNFQGMKHGHYRNACGGVFVHFKGCDKLKDNPFCVRFFREREETRKEYPDLFEASK